MTLFAGGELADFAESHAEQLRTILIVSELAVLNGEGSFRTELEGLSVTVERAAGEKCERCWTRTDTVGSHPAHPTLCARCAAIIESK